MKKPEEYARAYLPEWQQRTDSSEPEKALLAAAAALLENTCRHMERLPEKHERAFLEPWDREPQGAVPMHVCAALSAAEACAVPAGSAFYLSGDGTRLWRTIEDANAGPARLAAQLLVSPEQDQILPLALPEAKAPAALFDFSAPGAVHREVRFAHPDAFASQVGCTCLLSFPDAPPALTGLLADRDRTAWSLWDGELSVPAEPPVQEGASLRFVLPPAPAARVLLARTLPGGRPPDGRLGRVFVSAERHARPGLAVTDEGPWSGRLLPFGGLPEVWRSCCLSCPEVLSLRGAALTVRFAVSFTVREDALPGLEEPEYRPIMRRLPPTPPEPHTLFAEVTVWEYWNGAAWLPLSDTAAVSGCFAPQGTDTVQIEARFRWPSDAAPCEVQGQPGFWLRWRVRQASGMGWLPRRVHVPEVSGVSFSAVLQDDPVSVTHRNGLEAAFTPAEREPLFPAVGGDAEEWWLAFEPPPADPLRLCLTLARGGCGGMLSAWEATQCGLRPLRMEDGTDGLRRSGMISLSGLSGICSERFGKTAWWLCLRDESGALSRARQRPLLAGLACGAVRLRAEGNDTCTAGEPLLPLRGGMLRGTCLTDGFGGCPPETDESLVRRLRQGRSHLGRAVTAHDLEWLACGELRDLVQLRCIREGDTLLVGVLLRDTECHAAAFALRAETVVGLLRQASPAEALGLDLRVREPSFYPLDLSLWVQSGAISYQTSHSVLIKVLARFLHPVTGNFHGRGWRMGSLPTQDQLCSCIQAALPGVRVIRLLITARTPDGRETDAAQIHDPFALPLNGSHHIHALGKGEGHEPDPVWAD